MWKCIRFYVKDLNNYFESKKFDRTVISSFNRHRLLIVIWFLYFQNICNLYYWPDIYESGILKCIAIRHIIINLLKIE